MTPKSTTPADLLRQAAEQAPAVLPPAVAGPLAAWLEHERAERAENALAQARAASLRGEHPHPHPCKPAIIRGDHGGRNCRTMQERM